MCHLFRLWPIVLDMIHEAMKVKVGYTYYWVRQRTKTYNSGMQPLVDKFISGLDGLQLDFLLCSSYQKMKGW